MARPLRFRRSTERWTDSRVASRLRDPLDDNLGATAGTPWFSPPGGWDARRFDMDNGDVALFCWTDDEAFWIGNTETPSALWRTEKYTFAEVPYEVARWAQRELLATLHDRDPWFADYPHLSWFFLPVFLSKDGRESTRQFFRDHAGGFPDADAADAANFYEEQVLRPGTLDDDRHLMAGKLGTSETVERDRMAAAMSEFHVAHLLAARDHEVTPEAEVSTGHSIDFHTVPPGGGEPTLVEVTRPRPPSRRAADHPVAALRDTAATKTDGQLSEHGGGVVLFVDCSSFPDDDWAAVHGERPDVGHRPAVVFRLRPSGRFEFYEKGSVPFDV